MKNIFNKFILENKFNTFLEFEKKLINNIETNKFSNLDAGNIFESFNFFYFKIFNSKFNIKNCWDQNSIPLKIKERLKLKSDEGADGVVETIDGKFLIYQTKFKSKRNSPTNNELKKTAAESKFSDGLYIFTNAYDVGPYIKKFKPYLVLFNDLEKLDREFFLEVESRLKKTIYSKELFTPENYQTRAINKISEGLKINNVGKYISACGTGKTLTSLWVKEKIKATRTLFVVPSIWLIKQTVENWIDQRKTNFNFFCVVSNIGEKSKKNISDEIDIDPTELGIPYSTNPKDIENFINSNLEKEIVIFSTYHSLNLIYEASLKTPIVFDIAFYDEAHRTAGLEKKVFSICFDENKIKAKKKLFMTATPKVIKPRIREKADQNSLTYFSMDDKKFYGEVFEEFSFRDAIKNKAIVDYEIIIQVMPSKNDQTSKLDGYTFRNNKKISNDRIALSIGVENLFKDFNINKCINFSNSIKRSHQFINDLKEDYLDSGFIDFKHHIGSDQTTEVRAKTLGEFKACQKGVLSNARCLTEGVDVPTVDGVIFSDRKGSIIDIVQAVGRCLRKDKLNLNKIAKIFIPIILTEDNQKINFSKYEHIFEIIEALKAHDKSLVDEIDKIHLEQATGVGGKSMQRIKIRPHKDLDIKKIKQLLSLEISRLNRGEIQILKKKLQDNKKNKSLKVNFKICRYKINGWFNLINKGVEIIQEKTIKKKNFMKSFEIKFHKKDHNVISHMKRTGILNEQDELLNLNDSGLKYLSSKKFEGFKKILRQNLLMRENINFYPYKMSKRIIKNVESLNNLEFIYGIYLCKDTSNEEVNLCIKRIKEIKKLKINLELFQQNLESLKDLISKLNIKFKSQLGKEGFEVKDFLKLGRLSAEFNYFSNHVVTLWNDEFKFEDNKIINLN